MTLKIIPTLMLAAGMAMASSAYAQTGGTTTDAGAVSAAPTAKVAATSSDKALAKAVRRALSRAQGVNVSNLFVRARGGAVTLSGSVTDSAQIAQAEQVAKSVPGVNSVSNKLGLFHGGNG
jgi:hyperosmotically inducible periplasmic protein